MKSILTSIAASVVLVITMSASSQASPNYYPVRERWYSQYHGRYVTVDEIRQTPMVYRPNRPGHIFGNTVRAIAQPNGYRNGYASRVGR
jgi:hypothetical protein